MNYIFLGGKFYLYYMYFDLNTNSNYIADSLFYKREIPVKFKDEMARDGDKYRAIFCKIRPKYKQKFEEAMKDLVNKMFIFGHKDYLDYCIQVREEMELDDATSN